MVFEITYNNKNNEKETLFNYDNTKNMYMEQLSSCEDERELDCLRQAISEVQEAKRKKKFADKINKFSVLPPIIRSLRRSNTTPEEGCSEMMIYDADNIKNNDNNIMKKSYTVLKRRFAWTARNAEEEARYHQHLCDKNDDDVVDVTPRPTDYTPRYCEIYYPRDAIGLNSPLRRVPASKNLLQDVDNSNKIDGMEEMNPSRNILETCESKLLMPKDKDHFDVIVDKVIASCNNLLSDEIVDKVRSCF